MSELDDLPILEKIYLIRNKSKFIEENPSKSANINDNVDNLEKDVDDFIFKIIDGLILDEKSKDDIIEYIDEYVSELKSSSDESWHEYIDVLKSKMINIANKETKKTPRRRKLERYAGAMGFLLFIFFCISFYYYKKVDVSYDLTTTAGLISVVDIYDKINDYDKFMNQPARYKGGGWVKLGYSFLAEPGNDEYEYIVGYMQAVRYTSDFLIENGDICGEFEDYSSLNDDQRNAFIKEYVNVIRVLKSQNIQYEEPFYLVVDYLKEKYPCKKEQQ